ncbi:DUF6291 domain-containing protein [Riemerella anatipestifer]|nr:DUF6291 domain-containing protein [Riemerella anatipestifer]MDY3357503.1 DUF6291 domain-containing protein [Riemerella anatipestifer]
MSKTSFILHLDALSVLDELDDKQAGKLFKTIKEYQMRVAERCEQDADSGFDFVVEDFVTRIAFAPFKAQFIRDNEKYEETSYTRSEAGRIGNLKRWNKDLYEDVVNGKMSLQKAEVIANNRKLSNSDNSVAKHRKTSQGDNSIANIADKDSVSDSDKDSDKENNSSYGESEILRIKNFLKTKQQIQMDRLMMQHKISKEDLFLKIDEFVEKKVSWGEVNWPNDSEIAKNFEFWLSKNPNKATPNGRSKRSVF